MKSKETKPLAQAQPENNINNNVYIKTVLHSTIEGVELRITEIKKALKDNPNISEILIFGISNKLYKEILEFLKTNEYEYTLYSRSRIVIKKM